MAGRDRVSALAAWAAPTDSVPGARRARVRSAVFDEPDAAVSAALMLMRGTVHSGSSPIAIVIAHGAADSALAEADALAARANPGSILLTPAAMEAMSGRVPDGMALRAELLDADPEPATIFALRTAAEVIPHALPIPPTRLIGRAGPLRQLHELLRVERLVTLTGPPGSGKTRLAIEAGRTILGAFPDGAWFVRLAPLQDGTLIAHAVARTLGLAEQPGAPMTEVVRHHLKGRRLLLVVDNFEHLLDSTDVITDWLDSAPHLRVLATSREPLHLSGEREVPVPPLPVPDDPDDPAAASSDAVQLFIERARAADPSYEPDADALADVARICRRLDGLPLALELAAARTKALPAGAILGRLERSLELLSATARDAPARHRSLEAAMSWSHDLLTPSEQAFFRRLGVFRGGWTLEAADLVTNASGELGSNALEVTTSLLDKSLIRRHGDSRDEPRFEMLKTIRDYAGGHLEQADEVNPTRLKHARAFLELAERAAPLLTGTHRAEWLDRLEGEVDNFRTALRWTIDTGQADIGMRLGAALWRFWQIRAHIGEGRAVMADLLALPGDVDAVVRARALSAAGSLAYWQNDATAATEYYEASVGLRREMGDEAELATGLYDLGHITSVLEQIKNSARGRELEMEALEIYRRLGDPVGEAWLIWALGNNSHFADDSVSAATEFGDSIERFRTLDDPFGLAWALTQHGLAVAHLDDAKRAAADWREALTIFASAEDVSGIETVLVHLARLSSASDQPQRAITLAAAAARLRGLSQTAISEMAHDRGSRHVELPLTPEEVESARLAGDAMSTAEAIEYAIGIDGTDAAGRLRIRTLGRMQVERDGRIIAHWGGDKAGSRQAQAIFAFLFDRGERGVGKDEATELLWPDLAIRRADLAFHRTLGGLRSVLQASTSIRDAITHENGRYRLNPTLIGWSDIDAFEEQVDVAATLPAGDAIEPMEEARQLYRGDFLDDCPFYGDSAYVEERRASLRQRFEDLLVALGDRHAELGDSGAAAARYRQALSVNPDNERAVAAIDRLG